MKTHLQKLFSVVKKSFSAWFAKDPFHESAVIAYYAIFSLPGLLVVIMTLAAYFFGRDAVNDQVARQFTSTMGAETAKQIQDITLHFSLSTNH